MACAPPPRAREENEVEQNINKSQMEKSVFKQNTHKRQAHNSSQDIWSMKSSTQSFSMGEQRNVSIAQGERGREAPAVRPHGHLGRICRAAAGGAEWDITHCDRQVSSAWRLQGSLYEPGGAASAGTPRSSVR